MQRILIIGNAGSGKTTFARHLAEKIDLPLIHLDKLYWHGNWEHLSPDAFDDVLQAQLEKPQWIIDGNYNRTLPCRLKACDTVFFFDLPTVTCLQGITKRMLANYGKSRQDMGGNCPEYFDTRKRELYRHVCSFRKKHRRHYYQLLSQAANTQVIVFRNRRQADKFLSDL